LYLDTKGDLRLISPTISIQKKTFTNAIKVKNGSFYPLLPINNTKATKY